MLGRPDQGGRISVEKLEGMKPRGVDGGWNLVLKILGLGKQTDTRWGPVEAFC